MGNPLPVSLFEKEGLGEIWRFWAAILNSKNEYWDLKLVLHKTNKINSAST